MLLAYLDTMHPQNDFYRQLRAELEMLRVSEENDIVIELQGLVRPGSTNPEFAKITKLIERMLIQPSGRSMAMSWSGHREQRCLCQRTRAR